MVEYTFHLERPSKRDLFDGGSHQRAAQSIFKTLRDDNDINLIGVEGDLGSGKSTVVELVKQCATNEDYEFIEFDVERFQHGATKKALIETLYSRVTEKLLDVDQKLMVKRAKDVALGNHFEYSSSVTSNINIWIVWFALSILVASKLLLHALAGFGILLEFLWFSALELDLQSNSYDVDYLSIFSIFCVWLPWHIVRCGQTGRKILWCFGKPPSMGDIFKRNSRDSISETVEVNKEVGAYELQEALQVFVNKLPEKVRFILVIDNLDRVTEEKLREVWSDIEVFTAVAHQKIQLILPYSNSHISSALSNHVDEGREFISKRVPVTFRVSPIITADWKSQSENMIRVSLGELEELELNGIVRLIGIWSEFSSNQITPRYLKKLVNSIVSIKIIEADPVHCISAFFYQLTVQLCDISIDQVLSKKVSESKEPKLQGRLDKSIAIIERLLTFDQWSKEVVSIHYQTSYEVSESELLREPLELALENSLIEPFLEKQSIYAYEKILKEILEEKGTEKIISIISLVEEEGSKESGVWLEKWLPIIDRFIASDDREVEDISALTKEYSKLKSKNISVSYYLIDREFEVRDRFSKDVHKGGMDKKGLIELYGLSELTERLPKFVQSPDGKVLKDVLWPNRNLLPYWRVEELKISEAMAESILSEVESGDDLDFSLLNRITRVYRLGWFSYQDVLGEIFSGIVDANSVNGSPLSIDVYICATQWYSTNLCGHYLSQLPNIEDDVARSKCTAQAVAHLIYHRTYQYLPKFEAYIEASTNFHDYLADYLAISCGFGRIIDALKNAEVKSCAIKALENLIADYRINRMNVSDLIANFELLDSIRLERKRILNWMEGWFKFYEFKPKMLRDINSSFLKAAIGVKGESKWREAYLHALGSDDLDSDWWSDEIAEPSRNVRHIFEHWFRDGGRKFVACRDLADAVKNFFNDGNEEDLDGYDQREWVETLIYSLPKNTVQSISRVLDKELNRTSGVSLVCQKEIIINCGQIVNFSVCDNYDQQRHVLTLFENILLDNEVAQWFDTQEYSFGDWDDELLAQFVDAFNNYVAAGIEFNNLNRDKSILAVKNSFSSHAVSEAVESGNAVD